jgi:putative ABC transport system substrate-binding protein
LKRRQFIGLAGGLAAAWPHLGWAKGEPIRVGMLLVTTETAFAQRLKAFRHALDQLGQGEGNGVVVEPIYGGDDYDKLPTLAVELVQRNCRAIVTYGGTATRSAVRVTKTVPIVMVASIDPVALGFAQSLARPGGNVTGISTINFELDRKRLQLLQEMVPNLRRIAVLYNSTSASEVAALADLEATANQLSLEIARADIHGPFEGAFAKMREDGAQAFFILPSTRTMSHLPETAALAMQHRLPGIAPYAEFVPAGGLIAFGPNLDASFDRAAVLVDRILKGMPPGDLPIERPTKFELSINLKTAAALGLNVSSTLLANADDVIE